MAIAFHEVRFPTDIAFDSSFGPSYSTDVVTLSNKSEQRNINWTDARYSGDVAPGIKTQEKLDNLVTFFHARKGKAFGFRFKDFSDYKATRATLGVGNGTNKKFQLQKAYVDGAGYSTIRIITKPVASTVFVYLNGTLTNDFTVDLVTGIVTLTDAPVAGVTVTATFEFDVPVRFDTDSMPIKFAALKVYEWSTVPIVEIKVG